jgi:hypothetical protein
VRGGAAAWIHDTLVRQSGDVGNFTFLRLDVERNTYVSRRDAIVNIDQTFVTNSSAASKASFTMVDNRNTETPTVSSNMVFLVSSGAPHINDILIRGNTTRSTSDVSRLQAQSLTLAGIKPSSSFYYGTDGAAGGITDAPAGYNRFVAVEAVAGTGIRIVTISGDQIHRVQSTAGWRRVATVAFP